MDKRYVSLGVVCGAVVGNVPVPLEVATFVLNGDMQPLDKYSVPVIPSDYYDLSMVSMHMPKHLSNALEQEGLWSEMQVNSLRVEAADRIIAEKIERHCELDKFEVVVLCDRLEPTRDAMYRFYPTAAKKLDRRNASWLEVEPLKMFVETEKIYAGVPWGARAEVRAKMSAQYALQMRRTLSAGAKTLIAAQA